MRQAARHCAAAYVASVTSTRALCRGLDAVYGGAEAHGRDLVEAVTDLNARLPPTNRLTLDSDLVCSQQELSDALDKEQFARSLSAANLWGRARMLAKAQPHTAGWLSAVPCRALRLYMGGVQSTDAVVAGKNLSRKLFVKPFQNKSF